MRWHEISKLSEGVGLIVPGVNTTPDVGPNQTSIEAKKLGFSVDKAGKPKYTMHKKASKNTKANTLYNLGMTESQIKELQTKELSAVSEIYVDMDGVLADFFPAWKKLVGKDWRQITDIEDALQKISCRLVYVSGHLYIALYRLLLDNHRIIDVVVGQSSLN